MVADILQGLAHILVARLDDAGHEAILVGRPVWVALERLHLQWHHANLRVRVVEHALADCQYLWLEGLNVVVAVGHQVQRVEVLQVGTVGEAVVPQVNLELRVAVLSSVQVGEAHILQVLIAAEGTSAHVVGLVVVVKTDIDGDLQRAVVLSQEVRVGIVHQYVLGVPGTVVVERTAVLGHRLAILEEPLIRLPRLAG